MLLVRALDEDLVALPYTASDAAVLECMMGASAQNAPVVPFLGEHLVRYIDLFKNLDLDRVPMYRPDLPTPDEVKALSGGVAQHEFIGFGLPIAHYFGHDAYLNVLKYLSRDWIMGAEFVLDPEEDLVWERYKRAVANSGCRDRTSHFSYARYADHFPDRPRMIMINQAGALLCRNWSGVLFYNKLLKLSPSDYVGAFLEQPMVAQDFIVSLYHGVAPEETVRVLRKVADLACGETRVAEMFWASVIMPTLSQVGHPDLVLHRSPRQWR